MYEQYTGTRAEAQLRAGVYARLSETYDAAESVPIQLERGAEHATRRGWTVAATFKDDGYSAFKEITRDGFGELSRRSSRAGSTWSSCGRSTG